MHYNGMDEYNSTNNAKADIHQVVGRKESKIPKKWRKPLCIAIVIAFFVILYLFRPIYHTDFTNFTRHSVRGNTELLIYEGRRLSQAERIIGGGRSSRNVLIDRQTGRQLRLSRIPFHGLRVYNLFREDRAIVRNRINQVGVIDPYTRRMVVPFGNYWAFRDSYIAHSLVTVQTIPRRSVYGWYEDFYMGVVNIITGDELLAPSQFNSVELLRNSDRFVIAAVDNFSEGGEHRYGVFCLYANALLTDLVYNNRPQYQNGTIVLRSRNSVKIISLPEGEEVIPPGEFSFITFRGDYMAEVQQTWDGGVALIDVRTGEVLIDYGRFDSFGTLHNQDNGNKVFVHPRETEDAEATVGIYNLSTHEIIWRHEITDEEWREKTGRRQIP